MTSRLRTILTAGIILTVALFAVSAASASTMRAQVDGMIVIGDQVFEGGELQLVPTSGSFLAIRIDGRQVALVHRPDRARNAGSAVLTFSRDSRGYYHLRGLRYTTDSADAGEIEPLRIATVAKSDFDLPGSDRVVQTARAGL